MLKLDDIDHMSDEEVIKKLQELHIEVLYVPKAMIPKNYIGNITIGNTRILYEEIDIREGLKEIERRRSINK